MKTHHTSKKVGAVASLGVALAVGFAAHAEDPETLGLWTFDGESGTPVAEGLTDTLIPNKVAGADEVSLYLKFPASADAKRIIPPIYTNEVQGAYLFGDPNFTNVLATCTGSIYIDTKLNNGNTYGMPHGFLRLEGTGAALQDCSFTLEAIVCLPTINGWTPNTSLGTNANGKTVLTFQTNGKCSGLYSANTPTKTLATNQTLAHTASNDYFGLNDGRWHHFAVLWNNSTRKLKVRTDYHDFLTIDFGTESLGLSPQSVMTLLASSDGNNNKGARVQAIRLTRGELAKTDYLQTSPVDKLPETAIWWRFSGTPGEVFCESPNETLNRTDLGTWTTSTAYPHVTAWKPYVKANGEVIENVSGVGITDGGPHLALADACAATWNPYVRNLSDSFTCEIFLRSHKDSMTANGFVMGEGGGAGGDSAWGNNNWRIYQDSTPTVTGRARFRFVYRYWDNEEAKSETYIFNVTTNDWHHLALTYDSPTRVLKLFVDYKAAYTKAFAENQSLTRGVAMPALGSMSYNLNGMFPGDFDEYRRTRRALDVSEFLKPRNSIGLMMLLR